MATAIFDRDTDEREGEEWGGREGKEEEEEDEDGRQGNEST